jgi:membrane protein
MRPGNPTRPAARPPCAVPPVRDRVTVRRLWNVVRKATGGYLDDDLPRMGAALAYYTLFALAPMLIIAIAVGGVLWGSDLVRDQIMSQIQALVGAPGAHTVQAMLDAANRAAPNGLLNILGILTFLVGAGGAFLELQSDLDAIWRVRPKTSGGAVRDFIRQRVLSVGLVLGFGFLLLTALVISAALAAATRWFRGIAPGVTILWKTVDLAVSVGVIALLFAMIYKIMPDVKLAWRDVLIGALVTSVLFAIGKSLIGMYLGSSSFSSAYGAAASVIVILVWVYYSSQILLAGAEFTRAWVEEFRPRTLLAVNRS